MPYVVGVNYHWTPQEHSDDLARHFQFYQSHFTALAHADLRAYFDGTLELRRPGLLICFDDGSLNNYEVAAPLLEQYGLRGWFFLIAGTLVPEGPQIPGVPRKFCMSAAQARDLLARGHAIGSHTWSHQNLGSASPAMLAHEVQRSREVLEDILGAPVDSFCYPFGTDNSYSPSARAWVDSTYRFAFHSIPNCIKPSASPLGLGRASVAPDMDLHMVLLKLTGFSRWRQRRRLERFNGYGSQAIPSNMVGASAQSRQP
jgi:peptidoglycan/xylan/chitin deacetylase (PgdA/CDA1 family)